MNSKLEGHLSMLIARVFSGLNANALKYLIPAWIAPLAGVSFRVYFGALAFWGISFFVKGSNPITLKDRFSLMALGAFGFFLYQVAYVTSLKYTTPISCSIISSLTPVWTLIFGVFLFKEEHASWQKIVGIIISICGAVLTQFVKRSPELASDPHLGDLLALIGAIIYAFYLLFSKSFLHRINSIIVLKWVFIGASALSLTCNLCIYIFDLDFSRNLNVSLFTGGAHWIPILVLIFVLIFPTVVSYIFIQIGLEKLSATIVGAYSNVVLVTAAIASFILGQDKFSWLQLISILMFCVGLLFISYKKNAAQKLEQH